MHPTTDQPNQTKPVDANQIAATIEARLQRYQELFRQQKQQAILLAQELKEAEQARDQSAALVDELSAQLNYLTALPALSAATPQ